MTVVNKIAVGVSIFLLFWFAFGIYGFVTNGSIWHTDNYYYFYETKTRDVSMEDIRQIRQYLADYPSIKIPQYIETRDGDIQLPRIVSTIPLSTPDNLNLIYDDKEANSNAAHAVTGISAAFLLFSIVLIFYKDDK